MSEMPNAKIAVLLIELHIPESNSLKSKRRVLASFKERMRAKFNVSVAEIAALDNWQRSVCGVAMIGNDRRYLDSSISSVLNFVETVHNVRLVESQLEFL